MSENKNEAVLEDLKAEISDRILGKLPEEFQDAELKFVEVTKNNDEKRNAVLIQKDGQNVTPTIYLDPYVKALEEGSVTKDEVLDHIANLYVDNVRGADSIGDTLADSLHPGGFEQVKDMVVMQVVNTEMNAEGLKRTPHRDVEDLSIVYRLLFDRDEGGIASAKISDTMQQAWGVSEQDLFDAASKNTKELLPTKILPLGQMLENLMGVNPLDGPDDPTNVMYVITNESGVNGAAVPIYDKEAMDELTDTMGGGMFLLPSSVHEFIALPADQEHAGDNPVMDFAHMIQEVNANEVPDDEILGTVPYHYDKEHGFELASRFEDRLAALEEEKGEHSLLGDLAEKKQEVKDYRPDPGKAARTAAQQKAGEAI